MSEGQGASLETHELTESLRRLRERFDEFRGRL
jgi:hypothetical protein